MTSNAKNKENENSEKRDTEYQPLITANYNKKGAQFIVFLEYCAIILIILFTNKYFYQYMFEENLWLITLLPLSIYGLIWQFALYSLIIGGIIYKILVKIEPPKEGTFELDGREFHFYCYRFWIAYYTLWTLRAMPLPWVDMYGFKLFGVKVGKDVVLYDSWIDIEFVEIGDHVMLSLNTAVFSHCIYRDKFLVQRVVVEKNAIVGAEALVAPGTHIEEGAIIGAASTTHIGQRLKDYRIHVGTPCSKTFPIRIVEKDEENENEEKKGIKKSKEEKR